jgi:glycerol-3-phosphate dehydrogenase (NAD(P)+)
MYVQRQAHLERARSRGVNPLVYWIVRGVIQPFFHLYFRLSRIGREHIPQEGGVILVANHRSFLDPFVIGCMVRRPCYFVAKKELFANRFNGWLLNALGAFPIDRGAADADAMDTAREIIERGDVVVIFAEGTRIRPGGLGRPKRGAARLALQTGAPVVPIAVIGTEDVRKGFRIRPHKVRIRAGRPLTFPKVENPSPQLAAAVTDRLWPMVALQWEWLGGMAPIRRAAIIGAGAWGTGMAVALHRAGVEVSLGCRTAEQAEALRAHGENRQHLPNVRLPADLLVLRAAELALDTVDLVVLAVPARSLPAAIAAHGDRIGPSAAVLVLSKGMIPPLATLPTAFVHERVTARGIATIAGPAHAADALANGASLVVASKDRALAAQVAEVLNRAGFDMHQTTDVVGTELAGTAKNTAVLAASAAAAAGPNAAGAAAGKVFAEIDALGRRMGARPETFAGLAGVGDLVATVVADRGRGETVEGLDALPLLSYAMREQRLKSPTIDGLAAVIEGRTDPETWAADVTAPGGRRRAA